MEFLDPATAAQMAAATSVTNRLQQQDFQPDQNTSDAAGRRVRIRPKPGGAGIVYGTSPILAPLKATNGMVFPYQPTVTYNQEIKYADMELIHANQEIAAYTRTAAVKFIIEGEFSVQNQAEGLYAIAAIHFLRTVSKMHFGDSDDLRGTPPPVLLFDGYGAYMFNSLPVIVTQFGVTLPPEVDYVPVNVEGQPPTSNNWAALTSDYLRGSTNSTTAWLPALFKISVQLTVQQTPQRLRAFNLEQFRNGTLLKQGSWV